MFASFFGFSAEVRIPSRLAPACAGERDGTGRIGNAPRPGNLIISSWRATGLSPWRTVATVDAQPFETRRGQRRTPWRLATRHSRVPPASPGPVPGSFAAEAPWGPRRRRRQRGSLRYAAGASRNREIRTNCAPQVGPCTRRANRLPLGPRRNRQESAPHRQAGPFRQPATSGARQGPNRLRTFSLCYSPACPHHRNGRTRPSSRTSDQRHRLAMPAVAWPATGS